MKAKRIARGIIGTVTLLLITGAEFCGPSDLLENASFDLWCGDELCSWELEQGSVEKVATWHASDAGASLVGNPVVMSQHAEADEEEVDCIEFSLMAQSDPGTTVQLELDFYDDGITDYEHPIPVLDWETVSYWIRPPQHFDGIRFRIRKSGDGAAVLSQIRAQSVSEELCEGMDKLLLEDLADGTRCSENAECLHGRCEHVPVLSSIEEDQWERVCGSCATDSWVDCGSEPVCGVDFTASNLTTSECVDLADKILGEMCLEDEECTTGVCCEGQCSECCHSPRADCEDGTTCVRPTVSDGDAHPDLLPRMCYPNRYLRAGGEPCMGDSDCASGSCEAEEVLKLCDPGGQPCDSDSDCHSELDDQTTQCVSLGAREGVCAEVEEPEDTGAEVKLR